jgi:hypothetical protein
MTVQIDLMENKDMNKHGYSFVGMLLALILPFAGTASATIIVNGDFETGDLTGWTASATGAVIPPPPLTPLISVISIGGSSAAEFETGDFASGPFISTLEQTFTLPPDTSQLVFDFSLSTAPDPTGTGTSPFLDSFVVSLTDSVDFFDLLLVDAFGAIPDPFGSAPGTVALGSPMNPALDFGLTVDISALAGSTVTLFFDIINEDDGSITTALLDNVAVPAQIPEPHTLWLLVGGIFSLLVMGKKRCFG